MAVGLGLLALSAVVGITGISVAHFWIGLLLLGVGWNFGFIGATTMVTECHTPNERNRVQSFNDFLCSVPWPSARSRPEPLLHHFG